MNSSSILFPLFVDCENDYCCSGCSWSELRVSEDTKEMTNHVIKLSEHRKPSHLPRCCRAGLAGLVWPNSQYFRVLTAGRSWGEEEGKNNGWDAGRGRGRGEVGVGGTGAGLFGEMFEHPRENILGVSTHKLPRRDTL